mmetsp:Transcript_43326/g.99845  ORF Transcript_43326/g.99845 Transcript_43326/m.99845 type:complete len:98 (+) Transcript_43326:88-381(+)|eukprot:5349746-Amphidinium_carterae.1
MADQQAAAAEPYSGTLDLTLKMVDGDKVLLDMKVVKAMSTCRDIVAMLEKPEEGNWVIGLDSRGIILPRQSTLMGKLHEETKSETKELTLYAVITKL